MIHTRRYGDDKLLMKRLFGLFDEHAISVLRTCVLPIRVFCDSLLSEATILTTF